MSSFDILPFQSRNRGSSYFNFGLYSVTPENGPLSISQSRVFLFQLCMELKDAIKTINLSISQSRVFLFQRKFASGSVACELLSISQSRVFLFQHAERLTGGRHIHLSISQSRVFLFQLRLAGNLAVRAFICLDSACDVFPTLPKIIENMTTRFLARLIKVLISL